MNKLKSCICIPVYFDKDELEANKAKSKNKHV